MENASAETPAKKLMQEIQKHAHDIVPNVVGPIPRKVGGRSEVEVAARATLAVSRKSSVRETTAKKVKAAATNSKSSEATNVRFQLSAQVNALF